MNHQAHEQFEVFLAPISINLQTAFETIVEDVQIFISDNKIVAVSVGTFVAGNNLFFTLGYKDHDETVEQKLDLSNTGPVKADSDPNSVGAAMQEAERSLAGETLCHSCFVWDGDLYVVFLSQ